MNPTHQASASADLAEFEKATYKKVTWRLLPFLLLCYVVAYLDRVNVGFAKLEMSADLGFSDAVYGLGAGIFFIGYFLFEVPSNLIMHKVGARLWIARIMLTWGCLSAATAFVTTPEMFYVVRFALGVAEAGFFPGVLLYLTYWFPAQRRGNMTALFMTAIPLTGVLGGPLSGWILQTFGGTDGLAGWQWLFVLQAAPSILAAVATLVFLDEGIASARWLNPAEKALLQHNIEAEQRTKPAHSLREVFVSPAVWLMSAIYFSFVMGLYGIGFWLPTIIRATGVTHPLDIGWLTAIPYGVAGLVMLVVSASSDRRSERRWHVAIPATLGGLGLLLSTLFADNTILSMAAMTLATAGIVSALPLFWSLPTALLGGAAAAAGLAMINSIGNLAGFASPYLVGMVSAATHDTRIGMAILAGSMFIGAALTLCTRAQPTAAS
jgi:MFS family permease